MVMVTSRALMSGLRLRARILRLLLTNASLSLLSNHRESLEEKYRSCRKAIRLLQLFFCLLGYWPNKANRANKANKANKANRANEANKANKANRPNKAN